MSQIATKRIFVNSVTKYKGIFIRLILNIKKIDDSNKVNLLHNTPTHYNPNNFILIPYKLNIQLTN